MAMEMNVTVVDQQQDDSVAEADPAEVTSSDVPDGDSDSGAKDLSHEETTAETAEQSATDSATDAAPDPEAPDAEASDAAEHQDETAHHHHAHSRAGIIIEELRRLERRAVHLPLVGKLHAPSKHDVIYAAGMTALIAFGIVELPIALAVLGGHALVRQHHSRSLSAIGEVMEDFWVR
jgi:hypothetical protein